MRRCLVLALAFSFTAAHAEPRSAPDAAASDPAKGIDRLYDRLAKTKFAEEASGIVAEIDHLRLQSGSDAADLLLGRAVTARDAENLPLALQLFDAVVKFEPGWSEAWSERATTRFKTGDFSGAMADVAQTLKREPRDIGALSGLAAMMLDGGDPDAALKVYDRALKLAPAYEPLQEARAHAENEVRRRSP